ncbi:MAG: hypothetical protein HOK74_05695 [Nitrosomonadales bacterium]|nr:hypothetical protein [Nitrosomonadales bacterium]
MIRILIFVITTTISIFAFAVEYNSESNISNFKHGFQLGDLIVVEDQISTKKPFLDAPKLLVKKNVGIRLVGQESYNASKEGEHTFFNTITYQIFHRSEGKKYALPTHTYKIGDDELEISTKSYWFSRIASSDLNMILLNSLGQIKPSPLNHSRKPLFALLALSFSVLLILMYKKMDLTFVTRMNGPFTKANKKIKPLHRLGNEESYDESVLVLMDGCNKAFGQNMNGDSIDKLISNKSKYFSFKHEIKAFVDITNDEVYSSESFYSKSRFDKILYLSNELKIIERKL